MAAERPLEAPFRPGRRVFNGSRSVPWTQDCVFEERTGRTQKKPHNYDDIFSENFAGHTTDRIHKFDVFGAQKHHTGLGHAVSEGLLNHIVREYDSHEDKTGAINPHKQWFADKYGNYAGMPSGTTGKGRKPGLSQKAVMDEILLGRDIDLSHPDYDEAMDERTKDAAGCRTPNHTAEVGRARKPGLPMKDTIDKTVHGRQIAPEAKKNWMEHQRKSMLNWNDTAAGWSRTDAAEKDHAPHVRQARGTIIGGVVFGKDVTYDDSYKEKYGNVAGVDPQSALRIKTRSSSAPGGRRHRSQFGETGPNDGVLAAGQPSRQNGRFFKPQSRVSDAADDRRSSTASSGN